MGTQLVYVKGLEIFLKLDLKTVAKRIVKKSPAL